MRNSAILKVYLSNNFLKLILYSLEKLLSKYWEQICLESSFLLDLPGLQILNVVSFLM